MQVISDISGLPLVRVSGFGLGYGPLSLLCTASKFVILVLVWYLV